MAKRASRKSSFSREFTAAEANLILRAEGGQLTVRELVLQVLWTLALGVSLAWAIVAGNATVWHLAVPLVGEYLALLIALPLFSLFFRHPELAKESRKCYLFLGLTIGGVVVATGVRAHRGGHAFGDQLVGDSRMLFDWIVGSQMHWPLLVAIVHALRNLFKNVRFLVKHGPPFMGPGLGCAMRIVVIVFAVVLIPAAFLLIVSWLKDFGFQINPSPEWFSPVWILFGLLLTAELATLWFLWDVQSKLKAEGKLAAMDSSEKSP